MEGRRTLKEFGCIDSITFYQLAIVKPTLEGHTRNKDLHGSDNLTETTHHAWKHADVDE